MSWEGATLVVEPFRSRVSVRLTPAARPAVEGLLRVGLPPVGRAVDSDVGLVLGLGPDERLIEAEDGRAGLIEASVRGAIGEAGGAVVDTSESRVGVRLAGPAARDVLASCLALDLHPTRFETGSCAQTLLAKVPVLLRQVDDAPTFSILARPSMVSYLLDWLVDGMRGSRTAPA